MTDHYYSDPLILQSRLEETLDLIERTKSLLLKGLIEYEEHEIRRAIDAAGELRTALLDVMQTHSHSARHPYGQAIRTHEVLL